MSYRYEDENTPPPPQRASEVAVTTHEHVYEVDPRLMDLFVVQQQFPNWDTLRIMHARHDHLEWMHTHFAEKTISGAELMALLDPTTQGDPR